MLKFMRIHPLCFFLAASLSLGACTEDETLGPASPEMIELGAYLFHDTNLSEPQGVACASCHTEALAFTGNNGSPINSVARGSLPRSLGTRNSPSILYSKFSPHFHFRPDQEQGQLSLSPFGGQFWDGRAATLTEQAKGPFLNPIEMNNPSVASLIAKVRRSAYVDLFVKTYGDHVFDNDDQAFQHIADAISAYERSLEERTFSSKFDGVLAGQEQFTQQEAYGFALFKDANKGNCIHCHTGTESSRESKDWLFTNFSYESIGVPRNRVIPANRNPAFYDLGLCQQDTLKSVTAGLADISEFCGYFKVPTLRNIAITAPYMHNGIFANLHDVVSFYASRDTNPQRWYSPSSGSNSSVFYDDLPPQYFENVTMDAPFGRSFGDQPRLTEMEIDAIVAFLYTLSDRGY